MKLHIPQSKSEESAEIEELLKQHSLAYESVHDGTELVLVVGEQNYEGKAAIISYIDSLAAELHKWYYCDC